MTGGTVTAPEQLTQSSEVAETSAARRRYDQTWDEPSGFPGRLATVDNFRIGMQFLVTALSFFLFSGLIFFSGFLFDAVADVGWFAYTPPSAPGFAGKGIEFWVVGPGAAELAGIAAGAELTVSILKLRAPGMALARMPLYAWAWLVTAVMIVFAFTTLLMATLLLELDHDLGTQFFNAVKGGNHLLWQHLFWFFGSSVFIVFPLTARCEPVQSSQFLYDQTRGIRCPVLLDSCPVTVMDLGSPNHLYECCFQPSSWPFCRMAVRSR